ncbi:MAG: Alternative thymidylate synthase-like protein, partial [Parcubacteria group bacterium GW2011_GWA2_46_9]
PAIMAKHAELYERTVDDLFSTYRSLLEKLIQYMQKRFPKPADITDRAYETKLKARSLDAVRYLLPTATLTNFGMIMSARSLRHAIAKLMVSPYQEIREIGEEIKQASLAPAHNPRSEKLKTSLQSLRDSANLEQQITIDQIIEGTSLDIKGAPTLIKHTDPSEYLIKTNEKLNELAVKIFGGAPVNPTPRVDYIEPHSYEDELVTTLLYGATNYPYRQILEKVRQLSDQKKETIIDAMAECRGQYDQPRREYEIGGQLIFDVLMDYGAFRDLQRHRICTQINQPLTIDHGYETPFELVDAKLTNPFNEAISRFRDAYGIIRRDVGIEAGYLIPLAFKKRTLYKMDLRELYHMVELRSKPGGHMSYRNIVLDMYNLVKKQHPMLVKHLRVVIPNYDEDFFKR